MNIERLRRLVALRRSRAQGAEQEVAVRQQARDAARAVLDASLARQQALQGDLDARTQSLEARRLHGAERVATLLRLEEYVRARRLELAREQVVVGRAQTLLAQRREELEQSVMQLWRLRQRLEHCEALVRRSLQRGRLRAEMIDESMASTRAPFAR